MFFELLNFIKFNEICYLVRKKIVKKEGLLLSCQHNSMGSLT
jgi:hypothetical protein